MLHNLKVVCDGNHFLLWPLLSHLQLLSIWRSSSPGEKQFLGHSQCSSMISSRLGKMVSNSSAVRSSSLPRGLEKTVCRTLSIRTWACSVANNSGEHREFKWDVQCQLGTFNLSFTLLLLTVYHFLSLCFLLAELLYGITWCHIPPVGRVLLQLL